MLKIITETTSKNHLKSGLSLRPFGKGAVNFHEFTFLWYSTQINTTYIKLKQCTSHCFCKLTFLTVKQC